MNRQTIRLCKLATPIDFIYFFIEFIKLNKKPDIMKFPHKVRQELGPVSLAFAGFS